MLAGKRKDKNELNTMTKRPGDATNFPAAGCTRRTAPYTDRSRGLRDAVSFVCSVARACFLTSRRNFGDIRHGRVPRRCRVHFEGRLENGEVFDSSRARKKALVFKLGEGQLIPGLEAGIPKMSCGQICVFTIPPRAGRVVFF